MGPAMPALLFASPWYEPRIAWVPAARLAVVQVATPPESATPEQPARVAPLSWKSTMPVGITGPVTTTVKVTAWPTLEVYDDESMVRPAWVEVDVAPVTVCVIGPATPVPYVPSPE